MEAVPKNSSKLLLSCIVPGGPFWGKYYNISDVISHLDWVNILGYNVCSITVVCVRASDEWDGRSFRSWERG